MAEIENKEKEKNPGGRPTKYKPEMIGQAKAYIKNCPDFVPSLVGLAMELEIGESTLTAWKALDADSLDVEKYPDFANFQGMLERLHNFQKRSALNGGANGKWNSTIAKLILADHGMYDKYDHTTKGEKITPTIMVFKGKDDNTEQTVS